MFGNHGLGGLLEEGAHEKSPKCLCGNLGDFGEFCKGLRVGIKKRGWLSATPKHTHIKRKEKSFNKRAGSYRGKLEDSGLALKH